MSTGVSIARLHGAMSSATEPSLSTSALKNPSGIPSAATMPTSTAAMSIASKRRKRGVYPVGLRERLSFRRLLYNFCREGSAGIYFLAGPQRNGGNLPEIFGSFCRRTRLWREGNPTALLAYELSCWSDLAKWLMSMQERQLPYKLHFTLGKTIFPTPFLSLSMTSLWNGP